VSDTSTGPLLLSDPLIGARLGEYEIIEAIGEGGMGVVYRGIQPVIKKRVAIKVLKPTVATDANHVKRLVAEAEAVNSIGHRNIIDIFGLAQLPDGRPYIVMEFLDGVSLDRYLEQNRPPLDETLQLLLEIASPLSAAHKANVIHRDLKPSNVFLCKQADGTRYVKLLDFGLAKRALGLDGSSAQSSQALIAGTPDYMAPEQARGLPISTRTDIYALGVMAFEMLTGQLPFSGQTPMDVMMKHVSAPVPSPATLVADLPLSLVALVQRMLSKQPEERPQTVDEVRLSLIAIAEAMDPEVLRPVRTQSIPALPRVMVSPSPITGSPAIATPVPQPSTPVPQPAPVQEAAPVVMGQPLAEPAPVRTSSSPSHPVLDPHVRSARRPEPKGTPWIAIFAVLTVVIASAGTWWAFRGPVGEDAPAPTPVEPAPVVPTPVEPTPTPVEPAPTPTPVEPAPTPVEPAPTPTPVRPRHPRIETPSTDALRGRIRSLERALVKQTPKGTDPDPSALGFLEKRRARLSLSPSSRERARISKDLDEWEQTFLR